MRGKLSRMWRSSLSLMLVFCMLVSMAPAAFATDSSEPTTIKYVSLGDSVSLGNGSYPGLFASWLEAEGYADDVDHSALAMDAMRAEDLHFILAYGGANSAVGDDYTQKNFISVEGFDINETAQQYQAAVKEADLLTVGIGNANFGDFLMDCAMDAVNGNEAKYDVETALGDLNDSLKTELMTVYNKLLAKLEAEVGSEMAASLANAMVYTMVGYVVNYEAVLNDIAGLNPDAEVIIVPVINTMDGVKLTYNGNTYDIGGYIDDGLKVLNAYLALVATKYENTIFYAEVGEVALQANAVTLSRADIMETVVGENGDGMIWELLADQVGEIYADAELVDGSEEFKVFVDQYATWGPEARAEYVAKLDENNELVMDNVNKAISAALYLAFENAINSPDVKNAPLSVEGLKDLSDMDALLDSVMDTFNAELDLIRDTYKDAAKNATYDVVTEKVNKKIFDTMIAKEVDEDNAKSVALDAGEVEDLLTGGEDKANAIIKDLSYEIAVAGIKSKLNISTDEANKIGLNVDGIKGILADPYADNDLLTDLAYRGMAKAINDGTESLMTGYEEYKGYLDTYEEVKELYENENKVYELIAGEVNKKLCEGDSLTAEEIKNLVANPDAEAENAKLKSFADRKIKEAIETIYAEEAGNANTSLNTTILTAQDIVDLYFGDVTVEDLAYRVLVDNAGVDQALIDLLLADKVYDAAAYILNKENGTELTATDIETAVAANDAATIALVEEVKAQQSELNTQKANIESSLTDVKTTVTNRVAAQNIDQEIADRKKQIVDAANKLEEIKVDGLKKAKYGEVETDGYDGIVATIKTKLAEAEAELKTKLGETDYAGIVNDSIDSLCDLLGVSEALVEAVEKNATLSGLLNIMARCVIGDGLGMLPTANGHNTIAVAVETSYKTRHTVQDETKKNVELAIDKVIEILEENGMMIVDKATIKNALGYIKNLDDAVEVLKGALQGQIDDYKTGVLPALQGDLAAMQKLLSELEDKLEALEKKLEKLENKLNEIQNAPDAAASTIEALEKAIAETNAAIASTGNKIAYINTCIGALNEKLTQMSATLDELQAAIVQMETAVKALYNAVSTKDISFHDAFNNLEALHASAIDAIYAVEDLYHELKDLGKDTIKFIDTVKDEAKTAVKLLGGSLYVAYKLLPNSVEAKLEAEAEAKIADLKAQIAEKKAQLEQEVKEDVKAELQKQIDALEAEIDAVKAKLADDIEKLNVNPDAVKLIEDVLKDTYDAIYAEYENVTGALKIDIDTKNEVIEASAQAIKNLIKFAEEEIDKVVEEAKAIYADVLNADYTITNSSYYVALGDASAYSASGSYVDILAADPQLALEEAYKNAYDTRTIDEMLADIRGGDVAPEVKTADLITIRFDNSQIVKNAFIHAFTYMKGADVVYTFAWEELIGAKGVQAVNNFLTALEDKLEEYGMEDMKLVEMADGSTLPAEGRTLDKAFVHMAESYLYYSIQYMLSIPEYVAEIHAINPDAVIVFVGMSNPFGNTVLTHENLNIEVGNYVGTIVKYVDMIGKGFCMLFPNATYVSAQDVETNASNVEMDLTQFFMNYVQDQNSTLYPTATGHQYIKDQILKALTITDERSTEPECLLGDVNNDGKVDGRDVTRLARYLAEIPDMVIHDRNSDVNCDGKVDGRDLTRLARYLAEVPGVELGKTN